MYGRLTLMSDNGMFFCTLSNSRETLTCNIPFDDIGLLELDRVFRAVKCGTCEIYGLNRKQHYQMKKNLEKYGHNVVIV